jgi:prepilin-type N-terminal cleavage/methylation domain-containing protein
MMKRHTQFRFHHQPGFSLMELVIALTILALLAVFAMQTFGEQRYKARDSRRKAHIEQFHKSIEQYYTEENEYPVGNFDTVQPLLAERDQLRIGEAKDPINKPPYVYTYESPTASGSGYCICATLEGGTNGNSGADCDVSGVTHFCKRNIQ